jgi:hypothetical protein
LCRERSQLAPQWLSPLVAIDAENLAVLGGDGCDFSVKWRLQLDVHGRWLVRLRDLGDDCLDLLQPWAGYLRVD